MGFTNKYRVNTLIPMAIDIILKSELVQKKDPNSGDDGIDNRGIPDVYAGYISSFAADMVLSTPMAAATIYEAEDSGSEKDKKHIPGLIVKLLKKEGSIDSRSNRLSDVFVEHLSNGKIDTTLLRSVMTACTALKIAIRKFEKIEKS